MRRTWSMLLLAGLLALPACTEGGHGDAEGHEHGHGDEPEAAPATWATVSLPGDAALLEAPARTVGDAADRAIVSPPFAGRVVAVHVRPGDTVETGAPLVDVAMPEVMQAKAAVSAADSRLGVYRRRRDELEALRKKGLAKSSQVFEVQAELSVVKADRLLGASVLATAGVDGKGRASLARDGFVTLRAPVAGVVTDVSVATGEHRAPGDEGLVELVAEGQVRVEAHLAHPIPQGASLRFVDATGQSLELASDPVASVVEPDTGLPRTWLAPATPETRLPHGVRGRLVVGGTDALRQIPATALKLIDGKAVVLRRDDAAEGGVRVIEVQVQSSSGTTALVSGGLEPGDQVATDPSDVLAHGAEMEGGHGH